MAIPLASAVTVCSTCGEPVNAKGNCVACLLRTGLDESVMEAKSDALFVFGDFEIARREDGSLWQLGRGAMGVTYLARDNVLHRKVALKVIDVPAAARGRGHVDHFQGHPPMQHLVDGEIGHPKRATTEFPEGAVFATCDLEITEDE